MEYGLYVHVPYCKSKCRYCDFYTKGACAKVPEEYIDAVIREFEQMAPRDVKGQIISPDTVYFGGGTPGLMNVEQVQKLLEIFAPDPKAEVTLETNPETTTLQKLQGWFSVGVNRLSVGVQTANNNSLHTLGRLHTAAQAREVLQLAAKAGFTNITGDIMLALPSYSKQEFDETLALLQENGAVHISAYLLKIELGTAFAKNTPKNLPDADDAANFYEYAVRRLAQEGYEQYEISNFARAGYEGKHNLLYWNCENYLGIGPAAHSCIENQRFFYEEDTNGFIHGNSKVVKDGQCTAEDYIMLQLRLSQGLDTQELEKRFGTQLSFGQEKKLKEYVQLGLVEKTVVGWKLTIEGLLVQNMILSELLE